MKKIIRTALLIALASTLSACVSVTPREVTSNNGPTNLVGESACTRVFFIYFGDCGYDAAKKNGGITKVHHADRHVTDYYIFAQEKTIVYGTK